MPKLPSVHQVVMTAVILVIILFIVRLSFVPEGVKSLFRV
jgi:hypothetical protein